MQDLSTRRWDRTKWTTVFSSHSPTIRDITECLGLGLSPSASTTKRGIPKFESPDHKQLSAEVTRLSKLLPQERDELLAVAGDATALDPALSELLDTLGPKIWGKDADRSNLLKPDPENKKYVQDLFWENPDHRDILRTFIERWIIIKACYSIRNRKLKKPSLDGNDSVADADATSPSLRPSLVVKLPIPLMCLASLSAKQSPDATPQSTHLSVPGVDSITPPAEGGAQQTHVIRKRSSSAFLTTSDQEDGHDSTSGSRKRSHRSQSPSHPLRARASASASTRTTPGPDSARSMPSPTPGKPINLPSFSAVNAPAARPVESTTSTTTSSTAGSPRTFAAVNGDHSPALVPSSGAAPQHASRATGFVAVNSSNASPAAPAASQNGYASPYGGGDQSRRESEGHSQVVHRPPPAQREASPQKQPAVQSHHRSESPYHHSSYPVLAPNLPHQSQHVFHSHHVPPAHGPPTLQPKPHPAPATVPNGAGSTHPHHVVPSSTPHRSLVNGHPTPEHAQPSADTTLSQFELLSYLLGFFFPRQGVPQVDEGYLLRSLEHIWQINAASFRTAAGPLYDLQTHVLYAWIQERSKIMHLKYLMETQPGVPPSEMVDRLLAMNDLRILRLKWKALRHQDGNVTLSAEDLLCRCFAMMTTTDGTESTFKNGLERLNDSVFGFLKSEDMRICMGSQHPQPQPQR